MEGEEVKGRSLSYKAKARASAPACKILNHTWLKQIPWFHHPKNPSGDTFQGKGSMIKSPEYGSLRKKKVTQEHTNPTVSIYTGAPVASLPHPHPAQPHLPPGRSGGSQAAWSEPQWQTQKERRRQGQRPSSYETGKQNPSENSSLAETESWHQQKGQRQWVAVGGSHHRKHRNQGKRESLGSTLGGCSP